jgi:predicted Fe-Mo cluster-binding NifX family protein
MHPQEGALTMKIAVPSLDGMVDSHFGHCKEYAVYALKDGVLVDEPVIPSPAGCGCKSSVAADLARAGITHLVAGNMGRGALRVLSSHGITVIRGASGPTRAAAEAFVKGRWAIPASVAPATGKTTNARIELTVLQGPFE